MNRADHDGYGKRLMRGILGERFRERLESERFIDLGGVRAGLDGVIKTPDLAAVECAVEIEARNYKQIRGAILDLAWHPAPKKLLVVIRAQPELKSEEQARQHCAYVWSRLLGEDSGPFRIVVLEGTGAEPSDESDRELLVRALRDLGIIP